MNAAELASFRALLQAQAPSAPPPDGGLFTRMRDRLTVVEGGMTRAASAAGPSTGPEARRGSVAAAYAGRSAAASRVLARVEAVLLAEAAGLEARRAAAGPPP